MFVTRKLRTGEQVFDLLALILLLFAFAGVAGYIRACDSLTRAETASDKVS